MNNYKKQQDLMKLLEMMDDTMHEIKFTTTGQMKSILETQAGWFGMTVSEYVHRSLFAYMEIVAKMSGYDEEKEREHLKKKYPHND